MRQCLKGLGKICFGLKNPGEALSKLKSRGLCVTSSSIYDFSTLYILTDFKNAAPLILCFRSNYGK